MLQEDVADTVYNDWFNSVKYAQNYQITLVVTFSNPSSITSLTEAATQELDLIFEVDQQCSDNTIKVIKPGDQAALEVTNDPGRGFQSIELKIEDFFEQSLVKCMPNGKAEITAFLNGAEDTDMTSVNDQIAVQ